MLVLSLIVSLMLVGGVPNLPAAQDNVQNGQFTLSHQLGEGEVLTDCEHGTPVGNGRTCMMMNTARRNNNQHIVLRFDHTIDLTKVDANAKYDVWLQKNDHVCQFKPNDPERTIELVSAPWNKTSRTFNGTVLLDTHRIELDTHHIMQHVPENMTLARWQICMGLNPQNGADVDAAKNHPTGSLMFKVATAKPAAPELTGISPRHERLTATVLLAQSAIDSTARVSLRAIPQRLATQVTPPDYDHDPNDVTPVIYACPQADNNYDNLLVTADINPGEAKYKAQIDKSDNKLHATIELPSIPDETYVVCAYSIDKVSNVSDPAGPHTGKSFRASDTFAALQPSHLAIGHGCANVDASFGPCAAAGIAWLVGRLALQRRGRKTRP